MAHPLTDEKCYELINSFALDHIFDNMRRAYDLGVKAGRDDQFAEALDWVTAEFMYGEEYAENMSNQLRPQGWATD